MQERQKKRIYQIIENILMIASYSRNGHGETLMNYTTYYKTYTPK